MDNILYVLMIASIAYIFLFIISKLLGKKQIAELDFIDYVTGISIGSIAAEMATDLNNTPFYFYLISMSVFFIFDFIVTFLARKTNFLKRFLRGTPLIIIEKGEVNFKNLKKSKLDFYELLSLAREKGYFDLSEIEYAIFETTGDLTILATDNARALKKQDFSEIPSSTPKLTYYIIVDGEISKYGLKQTNKTRAWVISELENQNVKQKDVMYASYDDQNDTLKIMPYNNKPAF